MLRFNYKLAVFLTAAAIYAVGCSSFAQSITVNVNQKPISFSGADAIQQKGAVLVPLRGVFQALGAVVTYDPASKLVVARKGDTTISMTIGSTTASVNGRTETLDQPAVLADGSALVPIRFIAESFGAYVNWSPTSFTVDIDTPEAHLSTLPPPVSTPSFTTPNGTIVGQLTGIYTDTTPEQITLRVNGQNTSVPISDSSVVIVTRPDQPAIQEDVHSLNIGDQVRVTMAKTGTASTIAAVYGEIVGTIKSVQRNADGTSTISLNDGTVVHMNADARLTMAGRKILYKDIQPSDQVRIHTDENNKTGFSLEVVTSDDSGNKTSDESLDSTPSISASFDGSGVSGASRDFPIITAVNPAADSAVTSSTPVIYATLDSNSVGSYEQKSLRLFVDGGDVTNSSSVTSSFVTYQPSTPLAAGKHSVDLAVRDGSGVRIVKSWSFTSKASHLPLVFHSNKKGRQVALRPGDKLVLILDAEPGGSAFATIATEKVALSEDQPGIYIGVLKPKTGVTIPVSPVIAHYSSPDNSCLTANLQQMVSVEGGPLSCPIINSPEPGQQIGDNIQIDGLSAPGSTVDVTIGYATKMLGLVHVTGTAASTQVIADTSGRWTTDKIALSKPSLLSSEGATGLTITAMSVDGSGQHSLPTCVKVLLQ